MHIKSVQALLPLLGLAMLLSGCDQSAGYVREGESITYISPNYVDGSYPTKTVFPVDTESFAVSQNYDGIAYDIERVFCNGNVVEGADPGTFSVFPKGIYAKDSEHVFYIRPKWNTCYNAVIEGADPNTFTPLENAAYSKDKDNVFYLTDKISGADPDTFETLELHYSKDKNNVYRKTEIVEMADQSTFKKVGKQNTGYFVDQNNVFWNGQIVDDADPKTFTELHGNYARDQYHVYFGGKLVKEGDPDSFAERFDSWPESAQDKNFFYSNGQVIESLRNIDRNTWHALGGGYFADKDTVFFSFNPQSGAHPINEADAESFEFIKFDFAKDKNHVYRQGEIIAEMDPGSFEIIPGGYIKDKDTVMCSTAAMYDYEVLKDADAATFSEANGIVSDSNGVFVRCEGVD